MSWKAEMLRLRDELEKLTSKIDTTMREVSGIRHPMMRDDRVHAAVDELGAIVAATELATSQILDCAEELESMASADPQIEPETMRRETQKMVTRIYEACNFQDVTGQRVTKVVTLLRDIDERLTSIIDNIGHEQFGDCVPDDTADADARLLNGPSSDDPKAVQSSIDSLFA